MAHEVPEVLYDYIFLIRPPKLEILDYRMNRRSLRVYLVVLADALVLALMLTLSGCEEWFKPDVPSESREPDTAPSFSATVDDQTYVVGEAIAPLTLPQATGGNGALTYALAPTVPGLTFDPAARTLTGTPIHAGTYAMTYSAVDGDENTATSDAVVLTFRVTIEEAEEPPEPDTAPSFSAAVDDQTYVVGQAIAPLTLPQASGGNGALTYALAPTVPGLTFDPARRTLTGTPTHTGTYGMTYSVVDGDENTAASDAAVLTFRVTIEEAEEPQEPDTQPSFSAIVDDQTYVVGQAIAPLTLPQATGGNGALTYALAPTVPGLTFDPAARTLTGTPTHTGTYGMTYSVVDGDENTAASDAAVLTFRVAIEEAEEPPEPDTRPSFPAAVDDQTYVVGEAIAPLTLPQASGGNGALTYALAPTVPGLTFDPARRTLTGTPTHTGTYGMTYSVVDGDENTAASDAAVLTFRVTIEEAEEPQEPDTQPSFSAIVDDQTYVVGQAIAPLTLPQATGGNGALTYALAPTVPGLTFDPAARTLTGTPTHTRHLRDDVFRGGWRRDVPLS